MSQPMCPGWVRGARARTTWCGGRVLGVNGSPLHLERWRSMSDHVQCRGAMFLNTGVLAVLFLVVIYHQFLLFKIFK